MIALLIVLWLRCNHSEIISRCFILTFQISGDSIFISSHQSCFIKTQKQPTEVFLLKGVLKICGKFTEECRSVISIKLLCNFIQIALQYGCSPVDFLHIFGTPFSKITSGWLLLKKSILKNFAKFTGKLLWRLQLYLKRDSFTGVGLWIFQIFQ